MSLGAHSGKTPREHHNNTLAPPNLLASFRLVFYSPDERCLTITGEGEV